MANTRPNALMLRREGNYVILEMEINKEWVELIREWHDSNFSHIIEPSGIENKIKEYQHFQLKGMARDAILKNGTPDYCSPIHAAQMYKEGLCSLSDVEDAMKYALDYHMKLTCLELLEYMGKNFIECERWADGGHFWFNGEWITAQQLFENFL